MSGPALPAGEPAPPRRARRFPFWLLAIALLGVLALWAIVTNADYARIFAIVTAGIVTTLWVSGVAFVAAAGLGLAVARLRTSRFEAARQVATFYVEIVRGIPILVLLFYIAFVGAPWLVGVINLLLMPLTAPGWLQPLSVRELDFTWRAIIALTICYSAFVAEIFRAGIEAVEQGQVEAAWALGLSRRQTFRLVIWPQALRTVLPPLGNDFVAMVKDSALVSALGVQDITQLGKVYASGTFLFFETYNVVAFLYLVMTIGLSLLVRLFEQRLRRGRN